MYNGQYDDPNGDYVCMGLRQGYPEFHFDIGSGPTVIRGNQTLDMNQWHTVKLMRNRTQGRNSDHCVTLGILPYSHSLPRMTILSPTGGWMISYTSCFVCKVIMTSQAKMPKWQHRTARFF